ncbi:MAG: hypothetical protein O9310_09175 [Leptospiraceae bacterium]|nr:hypothetical protein [Leptospiraceae bacterium]
MISLESSYRGFKTTLSNTKKSIIEAENETPISVVLESDSEVQEYDAESVPTIEAIKQIFAGSKKITGYIYLGDRIKHKQILFQAEDSTPAPTNQNQSNAQSFGQNFNPMIEQVKSILQASQEIQDIKTSNLIQFYKEQDNMRATLYKDRENMFLDLKTKEMELRIKEIESSTKKKSDILESVLLGVGSGIKELINFAKENPGEIADIWATFKARKAE